MDRLSALDAAFLRLESDEQPMHVGSVMIFDGTPPTLEEFTEFLAGRIPAIRRYRQIIRDIPLGIAEPRWEDYPAADVKDHVRHTSLPAPGTPEQFQTAVARIMFHRLNRARPLWEMWLVEGLEGNRWAVLSKVHHAMVDGVAGTDLMSILLSAAPEWPPAVEDTWVPEDPISTRDLLQQAMRERNAKTVDAITSTLTHLREEPTATAMGWAAAARGAWEMLPMAKTTSTPFNAPASRQRTWATSRCSLAEVKQVRKALGGTVNDVVIAAITGGLRELLLSRGLDPSDIQIRTMVPVSVRGSDERGELNNKVAAFFAVLPVDIDDPVECLHRVTEQLSHLKSSGQAVTASTMVTAADFAPTVLVSLGYRAMGSAPQSSVQIVTTNVPGPQLPLYLCGQRLLHAYAYVPIGLRMTMSIGIFSYDGEVTFGINADGEAIPDAQVLADGIAATMGQLLARTAGD